MWSGLDGTESIASLLKCFMSLFPYRYSSVIKRQGTEKWLDVSRFHTLTDQEILEALQPGAKLQRGFRGDGKSMFVSLRIPAASRYHNASTITEIRQAFKRIGVIPRHYQIEEDWYLYIYLKSSADSAEFCHQLRYWCILQGLVVGSETIEIHPAEQSLPFPLQAKFSWLNERCQHIVRRDELSLEKAMAFFLDDAGQVAVDKDEFQNSLKRTGSFLKTVLEPSSERSEAVEDFSVASEESFAVEDLVVASDEPFVQILEAESDNGEGDNSLSFFEMEQVELSGNEVCAELEGSRLVIFHESTPNLSSKSVPDLSSKSTPEPVSASAPELESKSRRESAPKSRKVDKPVLRVVEPVKESDSVEHPILLNVESTRSSGILESEGAQLLLFPLATSINEAVKPADPEIVSREPSEPSISVPRRRRKERKQDSGENLSRKTENAD